MRPAEPAAIPGLRGRAAFTLLEVLAAVAILGIVYAVLAGVAIDNLRTEGDTARRLLASLAADRALVAVETLIEAGAVPPLGSYGAEDLDLLEADEDESGLLVRIAVTPFESTLVERAAEADPRPATGPSLLTPVYGVPSPLRRIEVTVLWTDGPLERSVSRTTFALDPAAALPLLEDLFGGELEAPTPSDTAGDL